MACGNSASSAPFGIVSLQSNAPNRENGLFTFDSRFRFKRITTGSDDSPSWSPTGNAFIAIRRMDGNRSAAGVYCSNGRLIRRIASVYAASWLDDGRILGIDGGGTLIAIDPRKGWRRNTIRNAIARDIGRLSARTSEYILIENLSGILIVQGVSDMRLLESGGALRQYWKAAVGPGNSGLAAFRWSHQSRSNAIDKFDLMVGAENALEVIAEDIDMPQRLAWTGDGKCLVVSFYSQGLPRRNGVWLFDIGRRAWIGRLGGSSFGDAVANPKISCGDMRSSIRASVSSRT